MRRLRIRSPISNRIDPGRVSAGEDPPRASDSRRVVQLTVSDRDKPRADQTREKPRVNSASRSRGNHERTRAETDGRCVSRKPSRVTPDVPLRVAGSPQQGQLVTTHFA